MCVLETSQNQVLNSFAFETHCFAPKRLGEVVPPSGEAFWVLQGNFPEIPREPQKVSSAQEVSRVHTSPLNLEFLAAARKVSSAQEVSRVCTSPAFRAPRPIYRESFTTHGFLRTGGGVGSVR